MDLGLSRVRRMRLRPNPELVYPGVIYTYIQQQQLPLIEAAYNELWRNQAKSVSYEEIHRANYLVLTYGFPNLAWEKGLKALRRGARNELDEARYTKVIKMIADCMRIVEVKWASRFNWPTVVELGAVEYRRPLARVCRRIRRYARCWVVMRRCVDAWKTHQQYRPGGVGWAVAKEHFEDMAEGVITV